MQIFHRLLFMFWWILRTLKTSRKKVLSGDDWRRSHAVKVQVSSLKFGTLHNISYHRSLPFLRWKSFDLFFYKSFPYSVRLLFVKLGKNFASLFFFRWWISSGFLFMKKNVFSLTIFRRQKSWEWNKKEIFAFSCQKVNRIEINLTFDLVFWKWIFMWTAQWINV